MTRRLTAATLVLAATPMFAHQLDEYLQGTILTIEKDRVQAEMTLRPGVAVFPVLIKLVDTDSDGLISDAEQRAYTSRLLNDLSLSIDGHPLTPRLAAAKFPSVDEMKEGRGEIRLAFKADLPLVNGHRKLTLENHHQGEISAYLVNCTVPSDPSIQIVAQTRNYSQSSYALEYTQADTWLHSASLELGPDRVVWLSPVALLMFAGLAVRRRRLH